MKRFVLVGVLGLMVVTGIAQQAKFLTFREEIHDFGTVDENGGPVTYEFSFVNNSNRPVKILKVQASCGCTTPGWSKEAIAPGKEGFVQASYNPKGRPGFFNKSLTVMTDLEANPIILQIKGHVTNDEDPAPSDFPVSKGSLKFRTSSFNMGRVYRKDEYVVRDFPVLNTGDKPITFTGESAHPSYIKLDVQPKVLEPGKKGVIKVSYNGALRDAYGFQSDNIELVTDDAADPSKSFSVYATLEDFFPETTVSEMSRAPEFTLSGRTIDFGNIRPNTTVVREVAFTNTGKKNLELRAIQPNCTCITATANKTTLKPGESGTISISFNPANRIGTQNKAVSFYTNDPRNPVQRLTFTAYVQ